MRVKPRDGSELLENPYLDDGDLARFERQYGGTDRAEQALHGGFAAATGLVYSAFSRETHVIPHAEARERAVDNWRVYGYDVGWQNPTVLLEIGKTAYDQLVVVDLFYEDKRHVEDVIKWLKDGNKPAGPIYCDHEPTHIDKLKRAGYPAEQATKDRDEGFAEVRKFLEADENLSIPRRGKLVYMPDGSVRHTSEFSRTSSKESSSPAEPVVGLLVSEQCRPLIQEFYGYKVDHVGTPGADDHCLDALRYALMGVASR
ncbi:hypothetical protein [Natrononativus amylolyticus]|uniref:hypothetical protein n=1 Tax=Natrononativus amylolyticus TaxID=2963434 RepID=UPI0020CF91A5|nr:hypothetical protein [Natrononativus amylolyticus]